jgi:hypothetical protein
MFSWSKIKVIDLSCNLLAPRLFRTIDFQMAIQVHFTPEQEAQLVQLATRSGTDAEHLVKDAALRLLEDEIRLHAAAPELPIWHLGAVSSFHRRDIYDDVR